MPADRRGDRCQLLEILMRIAREGDQYLIGTRGQWREKTPLAHDP